MENPHWHTAILTLESPSSVWFGHAVLLLGGKGSSDSGCSSALHDGGSGHHRALHGGKPSLRAPSSASCPLLFMQLSPDSDGSWLLVARSPTICSTQSMHHHPLSLTLWILWLELQNLARLIVQVVLFGCWNYWYLAKFAKISLVKLLTFG